MAYNPIPVSTINSTNVVPTIVAAPQANTTGNITTSSTTIVATDLTGVGSATVQFSGTFVGVNVVFEASADGTTYFPVQGMNQSTGALTTAGATGVLPSSTTVVYTVSPLLGQTSFRVRSTAFTSGSAAVVIHPSAQFVSLPVASQAITGAVTLTSTTLTSVVPGVAATSLGKAEDAVHASGDTGVQILAVRNDNAATTLTSASGDYSPVSTDAVGTQFTRHSPANTASITQVAPTTTSTTLKAANAGRRTLIIYNASTSDMYISYGGTASITAYTVYLPSLATVTINGSEYAGAVNGVWITAAGSSAQITETTI